MRNFLILATSAALLASPLAAAPCRDSHGKFIKCTTVKKAAVRCKAANGKFAKCGTPGAKRI